MTEWFVELGCRGSQMKDFNKYRQANILCMLVDTVAGYGRVLKENATYSSNSPPMESMIVRPKIHGVLNGNYGLWYFWNMLDLINKCLKCMNV